MQVAVRLADEFLFPAAMDTEWAGTVPVEHLDRLAAAGLYGLAGPRAYGGADAEPAVIGGVAERLAGGCLSTAFVWGQHNGLVRQLATTPNETIREAWLGALCRGERRAGLALGGLLPGPPRLVARPDPDGSGWVLDGTSPWVSGWGLVDALLVAARGPDGTVVFLLGDATDGPGLTARRQRLVAVDASVTVQLDYAGHRIGAERCLAVEPYVEETYSRPDVLRQNGYLALGVAGRCCRLIGPSALDDELARRRGELATATSAAIPGQRAACSELAVRAGAALMVSAGSGAVLAGADAARLAREAMFLLVFGSRPAIRAALLDRLGTGPA
jgi:alkylation response protein AidB-like acyl-CoA dehydrogenase